MPPIRTHKRKIACSDCGQKRKPGAGLSTHVRLHCKQKPADDTGPTDVVMEAGDDKSTEPTVDSTISSCWNPPEIDEAIKLCREYIRGKIVYTGRTLNANTFARVLPLYQGFVLNHPSFFAEKFGYYPVATPGPKGSMFALFRDKILPQALRMSHVHSDVDDLEQTRHIKRDVKTNGQASARCIIGWDVVGKA